MPVGKSGAAALVTFTKIDDTELAALKEIELESPSKKYSVPATKLWVRRILPRIIPLPVRVVAMVITLIPVLIEPCVILRV